MNNINLNAPRSAPAATASIVDQTGFEITAAERAEIDTLLAELDRLHDVRVACAPGEAGRRLKALAAEASLNPTAENLSALGERGKAELGEVHKLQRRAAKEAIRHMGPRVAALLVPLLQRFQRDLTELIGERDEAERAEASELGIEFAPSPALLSLVRRREIVEDEIRLAEKAPELIGGNLRGHIAGLLPAVI